MNRRIRKKKAKGLIHYATHLAGASAAITGSLDRVARMTDSPIAQALFARTRERAERYRLDSLAATTRAMALVARRRRHSR